MKRKTRKDIVCGFCAYDLKKGGFAALIEAFGLVDFH